MLDNWLGVILIGQALCFVFGGFTLGWAAKSVRNDR